MKLNILKVIFISLALFHLTQPLHAEEKNSRMDIKKLTSLKIPENLGSLDEVWIPKDTYGIQVPTRGEREGAEPRPEDQKPISPKIVLHIRDAHCIYEAQMHIAQLIEHLVKRYNIALVAVEGSSGKLDASLLTQYTTPSVREQVLQSFMRQGRLTGSEYAAVIFGLPVTLYGIEDPELYQKNLEAFRMLAPYRGKSTQVFNLLEQQLQDIEPHIYSKDLKEFSGLVKEYESGEKPFDRYGFELLDFYKRVAGPNDSKEFQESYPNVILFIEKSRLEKELDFKKVEEERTQFFNDAAAKLEGEKLNRLVSKSLEFRLGRLSALEYYNYLEGMMKEVYGAEFESSNFKYTNLKEFIEYEKLFSKIQSKTLFNEFDQIRDVLYEKLIKSPQEKSFLVYSRTVKVLKRLYRSEMTQVELKDYVSKKDHFSLNGVIAFLKENSQKYNVRLRDGFRFIDETKLKELIPAAENFYTFADERNEVIAGRLFDAMEKEKTNVAILVVGGFHTEAIKKALKEKGLAYAVITPNIQNEVSYNPYVEVMTDTRNPLEKFLIEFKVKGTQEGGISK
jgi:hypothetical protein